MQFRDWEYIPVFMQNEEVRKYYDILRKKRLDLRIKRCFDVFVSFTLIILFSPIFFAVSIWIKIDSKGPVFYRQERVTQYGKCFRIFKFRTMVEDADKIGALVTKEKDPRITKVGTRIRKYRIDEIPQLFNIITGDMSFVGTRPEVQKYVNSYTDEMKATLLLPAGVTSAASIEYKNEDILLRNTDNVDEAYVKKVLPEKMAWNLKSLREFSLLSEIRVMLRTVGAVIS